MYRPCTSLWPRVRLLLGFSWNMNLVPGGSKGVFCSKMHLPKLRATIYWGCVLMVLSCSTWFVLAIGVYKTGALGTYFQYHQDPIKIDLYMY